MLKASSALFVPRHPQLRSGAAFAQGFCWTVNGRVFQTRLICEFTFSKQCQERSQEKEMARLQLEQEIENVK